MYLEARQTSHDISSDSLSPKSVALLIVFGISAIVGFAIWYISGTCCSICYGIRRSTRSTVGAATNDGQPQGPAIRLPPPVYTPLQLPSLRVPGTNPQAPPDMTDRNISKTRSWKIGSIAAHTTQPSQRMSTAHGDALELAGTSSKANASNTAQCTICGDSISDRIIRSPCGHPYDVDCFKELFRRASYDESLFPPKCCQTRIPFVDYQQFLGPELVRLYRKSELEFSATDRVYCVNPSCSTFLGPATRMPWSKMCVECASHTCTSCKQAGHTGTPCDKNLDSLVMAVVKKKGWQRCSSCKRVVELNGGCHHITCLCGAQFCYLCGKSWGRLRSCKCPLWQENRL